MKKVVFRVGVLIILVLVVLTFIFLYYNRPPYRSLFLKPLYHFETQEKIVALTFDDGPSSTWTPLLLDVLKKHDVKATFFMTGTNIEKYKVVAERVSQEGHLIGNHSYDHQRMIFKTPWFISHDIAKTDELIRSLGVFEVRYYRPPYGDKMIVLPLVLRQTGKTMVTFDAQSLAEYERDNAESAKISDEVISSVIPGSIVVLHDGRGYDPKTFIQAVDEIITKLKADGYRFVTLTEGEEIARNKLN